MQTSLRPLTLGEILDRTAQLYRSNFWLFAGIASVYSGVILLLNLLQIGVQEILRAQHLARLIVPAGGIGLIVEFFVSFLVGGVAVAANNRAVGWVHLGEPATIRGAYASILPRTGRYIWLRTIIAFVMWTPLSLAYGGYFGAMLFWLGPLSKSGIRGTTAAPVDPRTIFIFGLATFLFVLLGLACLAYALIMFLRYSLAIAASVMENLTARRAIRRSIDLSKGSRGRIFVLALLVIVIQVGLVLISQLFFIVMAVRHGQLPVGVRIAQQMVAFVTNTFIGPIYATGLTLFYYDQRVRKEGYDIEWLMEAAGLTQPAVELAAPAAEPPLAQPPAPNRSPDREPDHAEPA